jgi:hypothetical protein
MKQTEQRRMSIKDIFKTNEAMNQSYVWRAVADKNVDGLFKHNHPSSGSRHNPAKGRSTEIV